MKKKVAALALALLLLLSVSCEGKNAGSSQSSESQPSESQSSSLSESVPESDISHEIPAHEVTDPQQLDQLWWDYFGLAIIPLQREFAAPEQMDLGYLTTYCWYSFARQNGGAEGLTPAGNDEYILPGEKMMELLEQYFNWKPESLSGAAPQDFYAGIRYDEEKNQFIVSWSSSEELILPGYPSGEGNPWGITLESFRYNGDGTATAVISHESLYVDGEVDSRDIYTMGVREEGDLYFISMVTEYVKTNLGNVTGEYMTLPALSEKDWIYQSTRGSGSYVTADSVILGATDEPEDQVIWHLEQYDTGTWQTAATLDVPMPKSSQITFRMISTDQGPALTGPDGLYLIKEDLSSYEKLPLPQVILEGIQAAEGANWESPEAHFTGYDVTADLRYWLYCDAEGLQLLDQETGEIRCLRENELTDSGKFGIMGYQSGPVLLDGGKGAMAYVGGYEHIDKIVLAPTDGGEVTVLDGVLWDVQQVGDKGLALTQFDETLEPVEISYYSFAAGQRWKLDLDASALGVSDWVAGEHNAAFVARDRNYKDENAAQHLWRMSVTDGSVHDTGVSVTTNYAASMKTLAALENGSVLACYSVGPGEQEVFLVP